MNAKNPPWQRDELIVALDLYFQTNGGRNTSKHSANIVRISNILNKLPIHPEELRNIEFRNPSGVYLKLMNFRRFDSAFSGGGMQRGNKLEKVIWDEFFDKRDYLHDIANLIIDSVDNESLVNIQSLPEQDEINFDEGKIAYRMHRLRERNHSMIKKIKEKASQNKKLYCWICGFDFEKVYGKRGKGFIECHHTKPISKYSLNEKTSEKDLVLVCSNCHRMLHITRPWLTSEELKNILNFSF